VDPIVDASRLAAARAEALEAAGATFVAGAGALPVLAAIAEFAEGATIAAASLH
jgi:hypothetical protein